MAQSKKQSFSNSVRDLKQIPVANSNQGSAFKHVDKKESQAAAIAARRNEMNGKGK